MLDRDFFFSFEGRAPRSEYWLFLAIQFGYGILVQVFVLPLFGTQPANHSAQFPLLAFVLSLPLLWPALAISVRRLHDRNKGSGWAWLFLGTPLIVFAILLPVTAAHIHSYVLAYFLLAIMAVVSAITLWGFVELAVLRGTRGDNRFGPDPLPATENVHQALLPGGHRVRLAVQADDGRTRNEYYYVAESDPERARAILRDGKGARDEDVKTIDTILHQTVATLKLKPGEFVPVPRAG